MKLFTLTVLQLQSLKEFGERLLAENHFDSKNIKKQLDHVVRRYVLHYVLFLCSNYPVYALCLCVVKYIPHF